MKTSVYLVLTALVLTTVSACSSYDYYTAARNKTNMSGYKSFAWMASEEKNTDKPTASAIADLKIKDAAVTSLLNKGLKLMTGNPDLLVTYTAKVGLGSKTVYYPTYYSTGYYPGFGLSYGWGYRPYYYGFGRPFVYYGGSTAGEREHYKEGTIIIDLIDTRTQRVVWRGFGVGEVHHNVQKNIDDIPKIVSGIINQLQFSR